MVAAPFPRLLWALPLIAAACAGSREGKMRFEEAFPASPPPAAAPSGGAAAKEPKGPEAVGSVELQSALVAFGARARKYRADSPEGSPMPALEVENWLQLEAAVDTFLDRSPRKTSSYDVIRARVTMEAELEMDARRYGDIPAQLADEVTERVGGLAVRMATLRRLHVRAREVAPELIWPIEPVTVTSLFGRRFHPILKIYRQHSGVDLAADVGQTVSAAARGTVLRAEFAGEGGNLLEISHGPMMTTRYEHLSVFLVSLGEVVQQGQPIGLAGESGVATGPHLHFELWRDGKPCDPLESLEQAPRTASASATVGGRR
ncbi:MAG TPA: M23 family metallopeptidase [Myxococcaceae bacterium]|nr:M23 family metallopeptidase [Myxococcaceae bacterium]